MKYKVVFSYEDVVFGYEGEEEFVRRESTRYFDSYDKYQEFMQTLDMAGDETTYIVSEEEISTAKSNFYLSMAKIVYCLKGYNFRTGRVLFYSLMRKALVPIATNPLCELFDNKGVFDI